MLGILATMQLLSIAGITLYNIFLIGTLCFSLLFNKKIKIDNFFFISLLSFFLTFALSIINKSLTPGFRKAAFIGGVVYIIELLLYLIMNSNIQFAQIYLKGFKISCEITLVWCVFQLLCYYLTNLDLNTILFGSILKVEGARGDYFNGEIIPSGFFYHRAILIPIFVYLIFSSSNPIIVLLTVIISCLTRSTALILAVLLSCFFKTILYVKKSFISDKNERKKIVIVFLIVLIAIGSSMLVFPKIASISKYIIMRIKDSTSNKAGNSSVVHFLYYKNIFSILNKESIVYLLFGTGFNTSGQHYTWFNGQYSDMTSWVVESDYINILLNQGIMGFFIWMFIMTRIAFLSIKNKCWNGLSFVFVILFVGILYNVQFNWFLLVEFAIYISLKNETIVFN